MGGILAIGTPLQPGINDHVGRNRWTLVKLKGSRHAGPQRFKNLPVVQRAIGFGKDCLAVTGSIADGVVVESQIVVIVLQR